MALPISERLRALIHHLKLTRTEFARECGLIPERVSKTIRSNSEPKLGMISSIYLRFPEINPHWLITGEGEMLKKDHVPSTSLKEKTALFAEEVLMLMLKSREEESVILRKLLAENQDFIKKEA